MGLVKAVLTGLLCATVSLGSICIGPACIGPVHAKSDKKRPEVRKTRRLKRALVSAEGAVRKKLDKDLILALNEIEGYDDKHPGLLYYKALLAKWSKLPDKAKSLIETLSGIDDRRVAVYLVKARRQKHFSEFLTDLDFRKWVGIDPGRQTYAYEKLMGKGGLWVEEGIPCEKATVTMELEPLAYKFSIRLDTRCQGALETTQLKGFWEWQGTTQLLLRFPNKGQKANRLECRIKTSKNKNDDDVVACDLGGGLHFALRPKRR